MLPDLLKEIPEFLHDSVVYCYNLNYKKNERSFFVLTKNLKLYEFRRKQLLHSIDLSSTCFSELKQRIMLYDIRKCIWLGDGGESATMQTVYKNEIKFGKFIYINFDDRKLYLLINCWNKLIVLQRLAGTTTSDLRFIAEYENVVNFKLVPSKMIKHQTVVNIQFVDGNSICMDFEENANRVKLENLANLQQQKSEFKQLLERIRHTKAELQFHKEITQKKFQSLKNTQTFGNNFLRSTKLDENPMLSRCGDIWIRFTSSDELAVGLPLVNNCTPANLTILKNLQPILNINNSISSETDIITKRISYEYRIYQLQQTFENLETLETFFQSEETQFELNTWTVARVAQILPTSFVVLLLKFRISQLMLIDEKCQLFLRFQIEKDLQMNESKTQTLEQHLFIKTFDFQEVLLRRQENEICFNEKTFHQDFLALAMTGFCTKLQIDFATSADRKEFENLLVLKFDFEIIHRKEIEDDTSMEIDDNDKEFRRLPCTLFYNRKPSSLWFGALIMRASDNQTYNDFQGTCRAFLMFYNKNEEKAFLMFKLLFTELMALKCNVIDIKYGQQCENNVTKITNFENAVRQELAVFWNIVHNENKGNKLIDKLKLYMQLQYNTDILAAAHLS